MSSKRENYDSPSKVDENPKKKKSKSANGKKLSSMSLELNTHYGMTIKDQLRDALINKKCYGLVTDSTSNDSGRPVAEANIHTQSENIGKNTPFNYVS